MSRLTVEPWGYTERLALGAIEYMGEGITMISRFALVAAAGMLLGAAMPAKAADLGGGCCGDLEERVAELEATVARKGNRVVSLQVYGDVTMGLLVFDNAPPGWAKSDRLDMPAIPCRPLWDGFLRVGFERIDADGRHQRSFDRLRQLDRLIGRHKLMI